MRKTALKIISVCLVCVFLFAFLAERSSTAACFLPKPGVAVLGAKIIIRDDSFRSIWYPDNSLYVRRSFYPGDAAEQENSPDVKRLAAGIACAALSLLSACSMSGLGHYVLPPPAAALQQQVSPATPELGVQKHVFFPERPKLSRLVLPDQLMESASPDLFIRLLPIPKRIELKPGSNSLLEKLPADGEIKIALIIGKQYGPEDEFEPLDSYSQTKDYFKEITVNGKPVLVRLRTVFSKKDFIQAMNEFEVIFVYSHSRYGTGWQLPNGEQLRMRRGKNGTFVVGPEGIRVLRGYGIIDNWKIVCRLKGGGAVLKGDDSDLRAVAPYSGLQVIVGDSCSSDRFSDELEKMRCGRPTKLILCRGPAKVYQLRLFLRNLFSGRSAEEIVESMNNHDPKAGYLLIRHNLGSYENSTRESTWPDYRAYFFPQPVYPNQFYLESSI